MIRSFQCSWCFIALVVGWLSCASNVLSQPTSLTSAQDLHWRIDALKEGEGAPWSFSQAQSPAQQRLFKTVQTEGQNINLGFSPQGQWLRMTLDHASSVPATWVLELAYQPPDWVDVYLPDGSQVLAGSLRGRASQQLEHRFFAVPMRLQPGENVLFMRVQSDTALTLPLRVWAPVDFLRYVQNASILQALYFGALGAMTLYNFFLAVSLRDRRFGLYVLFALTLAMGIFSGNGYGRLYLWTDALAFDRVAQTFFLCLSGVFSVAFSRAFLQLDQTMRWIDRSLALAQALMLSFAIYLAASIYFDWPLQAIFVLLIAVALPMGMLILVAGVRALLQGLKGSRFFMLAWSVLWLGVFVASLRMLNWLPSNTLTLYALQIASVLEMLLLAFALADIVLQERAQRDLAQSAALRLEQRLVTQLQASEERLEQAVQTRTAQLQDALDKQQLMLDQYVRFGALISHEFRNPLGIVQSQISLLRRQSTPQDTELSRRLDIMSSAVRRLVQLFERWLQGGRLHHLEKDLHIESVRVDQWLHHLLQAHPLYRATHRVVLVMTPAPEGAPQSWAVLADESLLEIAVLNLLDNACKYAELGTEVRIELRREAAQVGIAVIDQGPGICPDQQKRIFGDYVRLQPEGPVHGIGLGLAFVQRIAAVLNGSVKLDSSLGQGSTFSLWLPAFSAKNPS